MLRAKEPAWMAALKCTNRRSSKLSSKGISRKVETARQIRSRCCDVSGGWRLQPCPALRLAQHGVELLWLSMGLFQLQQPRSRLRLSLRYVATSLQDID